MDEIGGMLSSLAFTGFFLVYFVGKFTAKASYISNLFFVKASDEGYEQFQKMRMTWSLENLKRQLSLNKDNLLHAMKTEMVLELE